MRRLPLLAVLVAVLVGGCSSASEDTDGGPTPAVESSTADEAILADYGLAGMDTVEIIDHLDRLGGEERPTDLMASVRVEELLLSTEESELAMPMPDDRFYLSVAPYVDRTHECFFHSLTTCQGEMVSQDVDVTIVDDATGEVLVDEQVTTFENGFAGFWLPRDIEATLTIEHEGRTGTTQIATDEDSPSCLTTVQLA